MQTIIREPSNDDRRLIEQPSEVYQRISDQSPRIIEETTEIP
jgi:hypothetical protein